MAHQEAGGYTQHIEPTFIISPPVTLHPERLFVQKKIEYQMLEHIEGDREREQLLAERVVDGLVEQMVREIIERGDAVLACEPDFSYEQGGPRLYSMSLCIIPANEWMKTQLGDIMSPHQLRVKEA